MRLPMNRMISLYVVRHEQSVSQLCIRVEYITPQVTISKSRLGSPVIRGLRAFFLRTTHVSFILPLWFNEPLHEIEWGSGSVSAIHIWKR